MKDVFRLLDALLACAVDKQAQRLGPASLLDPWRGLHLDASDVRRVLGELPHVPLGPDEGAVEVIGHAARGAPRIANVAAGLGLANIDLAMLVLALAPDLDLRYERVYAYLQDDIARKRPSIDLVLGLLCADVDERAQALERLQPHAPLMRFAVLEARGPSEQPLLARALTLETPWRNYLLGREELDPRLAAFARLLPAAGHGLDGAFVEPAARSLLESLVADATAGRADVRLLLSGPHGAGKAALAGALARELGMSLLVLDLRDAASASEVRATLERARTAGVLLQALPYIHGVARLGQRDPQLLRATVETLAGFRSWFVLAVDGPLPQTHAAVLRARSLALDWPSEAVRLDAWRASLAANDIAAAPAEVEQVARQFRLSAALIAQAVAEVAEELPRARPRQAVPGQLAAAARALCGGELARLAQRIAPEAGFEALVATPEVEDQLREICLRVATRDAVRRDWTRDSVHARNAGVTALFAGPSGTGKTLAAEVIARELGFDLFRIDLSAIVSKYIGETEKNLDRVFNAAQNANAVLFFDEADALFGKRSEVKDAHDRYANIEIAYLLQKMEQFDGLAILATNLKQNLDEAFARRLTFSVNFSFPEASERLRLWKALWPPHAPRADDVDFAWLAGEYSLSGGNIRNMVIAAAHLAAGNGQLITREHVLHATRREYQKLGKNLVIRGPA